MNPAANAVPASAVPPVVFVHGWGSSGARTWAGSYLERRLVDDGRQTYILDLLGHGSSRAPHAPADYAHIADDLAQRLPGDENTVLDAVGFSLGGKLLLQLAVAYPRRFRRLVIAGVGDNLFRPENGAAVAALLAQGSSQGAPEMLRPVLDEAFSSGNDMRALAASIQRPSTPLTPADLRTVVSTVLLIGGDNDKIAGSATLLEEALAHVECTVVEGLGHADTPRSPHVLAAAWDFLSARGVIREPTSS